VIQRVTAIKVKCDGDRCAEALHLLGAEAVLQRALDLAHSQGWTHVEHPPARERDYCPRHAPP
jgi:hypothetical protein